MLQLWCYFQLYYKGINCTNEICIVSLSYVKIANDGCNLQRSLLKFHVVCVALVMYGAVVLLTLAYHKSMLWD
jgi:hypothetical protein